MLFSEVDALADLNQQLPQFVELLDRLAVRLGLPLDQFPADHICVRCYQYATADRWRLGLLCCGHLLSEKIINDRPVCLFILHTPLQIGPWQIDCVELPYPGNKHYPQETWEHVEMVLPVPPEQLHQAALACLPDSSLLDHRIKLKFSQSKDDRERLANPTLAVTDGSITLKFHPYSIQEIVASEAG